MRSKKLPRTSGKPAKPVSVPPRSLIAAGVSLALARAAMAAQLPVPCVVNSCGSGNPATFVTSGVATAVATGSSLTVNQTSQNAVLNWKSFNISSDGKVTFQQPNATSVAINRIFQGSPSQIFGALGSNGYVYLINQNGVIFGQNSQVSVGGLVASSLNITPEALQYGIAGASTQRAPAFTQFTDPTTGAAQPSGAVTVQKGATLTTTQGGQILMFAPEVTNEGNISTPGGQTMLAAGSPVYLATSSDPNLRGLLVEVGTGGTVTNGSTSNAGVADPNQLIGQISADTGNVTLAGYAVNQLGRVSATTSVRSNGSVRLIARDGGSVQSVAGSQVTLTATREGTLTLGQNSSTQVTLSTDGSTTVDANTQPTSIVYLEGQQIDLLQDARVTAPSGQITLLARTNPATTPGNFSPTPDNSRIYLAAGATVDASGTDVTLPMESNVISVQLRSGELQNSPIQRNGPLHGDTVQIDIRASGVNADGTTWQGTPLANVSGDIAAIPRTVQERSLNGGTVNLTSEGSVLLASGSKINASGGATQFLGGFVDTTYLLGANGIAYNIADADPNRVYVGIANTMGVAHPHWGVTQTFPGFTGGTSGTYEAGYIQGADAGVVSIVAPRAVLDGSVVEQAIVGPFQRQASSATFTGLYRPYDQLPLPGELDLGNLTPTQTGQYLLPDVDFAEGTVLTDLKNSDGSPFDPLKDPLPASLTSVRVRPSMIAGSGIGILRITSGGTIDVPQGTDLNLPTESVVQLQAGTVNFDGALTTHGGSVSLAGSTVNLGAHALLDVSGQWVNDNPALGPGTAALDINGGSVALSSTTLTGAAGSVVDASAGAWRQAGGTITYGSGGHVSLVAQGSGSGSGSPPLSFAGQLSAYAFQNGGTLTLSAPALCIGAGGCTDLPVTPYEIAPQLFTSDGFANFVLTGLSGGVEFTTGTSVTLQQHNLEFTGSYANVATGAALAEFTAVGLLDASVRKPVNLSVQATYPQLPTPITNANFQNAPQLLIDKGAQILGDPGSSIALRTSGRMLVDGLVQAPGGAITLTLDGSLELAEYVPSQGIWLGQNAVLDASGHALINASNGIRSGSVLGGGSVTIQASRGYIVTDPSSLIDVSGASGVVDVLTQTSGSAVYRSQEVDSAGGSITLQAAEGMLLNGALNARAGGQNPAVAGGSISLSLDASQRGSDVNFNTGESWLYGARDLIVSGTVAPTVVKYGTPIPDVLNGQGLVSAQALDQSGADFLTLASASTLRDLASGQRELESYGTVTFQGNVTLAPRGRLIIDAPVLASGGGAAQLSSAYVALGNSQDYDPNFSQQVPGATAGSGKLAVSAQLIDLIGDSVTQGFGQISLDSAGDLRLRGLAQPQGTLVSGSLTTGANLTLQAQQIYPTTFTDFTLTTLDPTTLGTGGQLTIAHAPGVGAVVLSAGGELTLNSGTINDTGVLRAPFGSLVVNAQTLNVGTGGVLSTSAEGQTIPFGTTQAGTSWVYTRPDGTVLVIGPGGQPLPAQNISLNAQHIALASGSSVNVSGGGDLQAYEFVPGINGTNDVLSTAYNPNQYAILPGLKLPFAPYDPYESQGFNLQPGQSITLSKGAPGLTAGTYALLPARYALLPGAYLVTAVTGYTDIQPGQAYSQLGVGTVIAGQMTVAGTPITASRSSGYLIQPGNYAQLEAQYNLTSANAFFGAEQSSGVTLGFRLPKDAGILTLAPTDSLVLDGTLNAAAATGGRGAEIELAATNLEILGSQGAAQESGAVAVSAASLTRLGAQTLVLGADLTQTTQGTQVQVLADTLQLDSGVSLSGPEVVLAAQDSLTLQSGVQLTSTAGAPPLAPNYLLQGNAAFVRVSGGGQATLTRTGADGTRGSIQVASGARISSAGSVMLDASSNTVLDGTLSLHDAALWLGASSVALGNAPAGTSGLVLSSAQLAALQISDLHIATPGLLVAYGPVNLTGQDFTIDSAGISAGDTTAAFNIKASGTVDLGGSGVTQVATSGSATLNVSATTVNLDSGPFVLSGFATAGLTATGQLVANGDGALTSSGSLQLNAPRVISANGVTYAIQSDGALVITASGSAAKSATLAPGIGGRIDFTAGSIDDRGTIELPSGVVSLTATTAGVTLGSGALVDVSGASKVFDSVSEAAPGGVVQISSNNGSIALDSGSRIDVAAAPGPNARAGAITLTATQGSLSIAGELDGSAQSAALGGAVSLEAESVGSFTGLVHTFAAGGFTGSQVIHQRGAGDLVLAAGDTIIAQNVSITADAGAIDIAGTINASGSSAGNIGLYASGNVTLSGALLARASGVGAAGGKVDLESTTGGIVLNAGSTVDVSGGAPSAAGAPAAGGDILLRVGQSVLVGLTSPGSGTPAVALSGTLSGYRGVTIEGYEAYDRTSTGITFTDVSADPSNPIYANAQSFMSNAPAILQALGVANNPLIQVVPGVEIDSTADLHLSAPWDLSTWRFGPNNDLPGVLTLRAAGNLYIDNPLSDGIDPAFFALAASGNSWSYRLVAGANSASANPLAVRSVNELSAGAGSVIIGPGTTGYGTSPPIQNEVVTGTGSIQVAAGLDFVLSNSASVLYTAGVSGPGIPLLTGLQLLPYPTDGGDITISAGRNVVGAPSQQLVTDWLWRTGQSVTQPEPSATGWTVAFGQFAQGVGALGGGNVTVTAGGNITDLSASIPSIGVQVGGVTAQTSVVDVTGGGALQVRAGGDISGGSYYVGLGSGVLLAGNAISRGSVQPGATTGFYPVLALGDATLSAYARTGLGIESVVNPTLLPESRAEVQGAALSYFSTYGPNSAVNLMSAGSDVQLVNAESASSGVLATLPSLVFTTADGPFVMRLYPPSLTVTALSGDVNVGGNLSLYPSQTGTLNLFAADSVTIGSAQANDIQVIASDADLSQLPSIAAPGAIFLNQYFVNSANPVTGFYSPTPLHAGDSVPNRLVALSGDVSMESLVAGDPSSIFSAKPVDVVAGQDIVDLGLLAQNLDSSSVTSLTAGHDITYSIGRDSSGRIQSNSRGVTVAGPGYLVLTAGHDVNLETSNGILTVGNLQNPALSPVGASVDVVAGLNSHAPGTSAFINTYLVKSNTYDSELIDFITETTGLTPPSKSAALADFEALSPQLQAPFLDSLLIDELRTSGRAAAAAGATHDNFTQGFDALTTLFPGSNPTGSQTNAYSGDILFYFSRIYTLSGGDITLLAPGGLINVGLATPPAAFGLSKTPAQLGLVAQRTGSISAVSYGDFDVNQSRVFAADGGNILVWSTDGNIDAGRGAKTAISAPPPQITIDPSTGAIDVLYPPALTGSGIQTLATTPGTNPGDVDLFAPRGVVNANDAGIVAGNLTIAATAVLGANNIKVSGIAVGVPNEAGGLSASLAGASSVASAASSAATAAVDENGKSAPAAASEAATSWLDVFVEGFGEENCKPTDQECLNRSRKQ